MNSLARRWLLVGVVPVISMLVVAGGCRDEASIRDSDLEEFRALLDNGIDYGADPFVRAETLHLLERMRAPEYTSRIEARLEDRNPMVRVAAVRALLALGYEKGDAHATSQFTGAKTSAKRGIVKAVLDHSDESTQRDFLWRAVQHDEPASIRRYAFGTGLVPRVEAAMERGDESFVRKLFLPNVNRYVEELDTELGGLILRLMLRFDESERTESVIDEFTDGSNEIERRLRAAQILIEAGAESAKPAYERILDRAQVEPNHGDLRVPEKRIDKRLVRAAVLGMVSAGDEAFVTDAKDYMKEASTDQYIQTLQALSHNPNESARLALETALRDARPEVRRRAIILYGRRDDADLDLLMDIHASDNFKRGTAETRYTVARTFARRASTNWVENLENRLTSDEGILPTLELLEHVVSQRDDADVLVDIRQDLVRIAKSDREEAAPLAGYLLMQLPDDVQTDEMREIVRGLEDPTARYAYLANIRERSPGEHTDFLIEHLYAEGTAPELYAIRLMAGAGLWRARNPSEVSSSEDGDENPEVAAQ